MNPRTLPNTFLLILLAITVAACDNQTLDPEGSGSGLPDLPIFNSSNPSSVRNQGMFYAVANRFQGDGPVTYQSGGQIYDNVDHDNAVNGGTMTASNLPITWGNDNQYFTFQQTTFGAVTTWGLSGNPAGGVPAFTTTMYVPELIELTGPVAPTLFAEPISISNGVTVTWNIDPHNDSIAIGYEYLRFASTMKDSTLPLTKIQGMLVTADDGHHVIPAATLSQIPVGGHFEISVARGVGKTTGTSTEKFYIYAYTKASEVFEALP